MDLNYCRLFQKWKCETGKYGKCCKWPRSPLLYYIIPCGANWI